jgi:hypothetical protein
MPRLQKGITPATEQKIYDLIVAVEETGTFRSACEAVGVDTPTYTHLLKLRPDLDALVHQARERGREKLKDRLESVAIKRAEAGSDILLMFMLKKLDPSYRDSYHVTTSSAPVDYVIDLTLPDGQAQSADSATTTILE